MKRIAVPRGGVDAAGINAAVGSVVRAGIAKGREPLDVHHDCAGLIRDDFVLLGFPDLAGKLKQADMHLLALAFTLAQGSSV